MESNRNQITYFLGAGASYYAIPCVEGLPYRFKDLIIYLEDILFNMKSVEHPSNLPAAYDNLIGFDLDDKMMTYCLKNTELLINDIKWIIDESHNHQTIDTLAKRFYLTKEYVSLIRLKKCLTAYFVLEQNIFFPKTKVSNSYNNSHDLLLDKRYDNLIASISDLKNDNIVINNNIKIVTWNYDMQLEYALKNYFPDKNHTISSIRYNNQIFPNRFLTDSVNKFNLNRFGVFKLNGSAYNDSDLKNFDSENFFDYRFGLNDIKPANILYHLFKSLEIAFENDNNNSNMLFSWEEKNSIINQSINNAFLTFSATKILIIIGYSFPFFNSKMDRYLLQQCLPNEIIIEDNNFEIIKERLISVMPHIKGTRIEKSITKRTPSSIFYIHPET